MTTFYLQVCENGHLRSDFRRVKEGDTCKLCGAKLTDKCPRCGELLKIWYYYGSVPKGPKPDASMKPEKCGSCGFTFMWK